MQAIRPETPLSYIKHGFSVKILLLALFLFAYFGARLPFFQTGWDGTDANGHGAYIFLHHPAKPNYLFVGRLHGEEIFSPIGHPALMYEMFSWLGSLMQNFIDFRSLNNQAIIFRIKFLAATIQLSFFLLLIAIIFWNREKKNSGETIAIFATLAVLAFSPIAINNSNEFQLDSLQGLTMVGCYTFVLSLFTLGMLSRKVALPAVFLSAAFLGLGKNEWSTLLVLSLLGGAAYPAVCRFFFPREKVHFRFHGILLAVSFAGCFFGNLISYYYEPGNYLSGWHLMMNLSQKETLFSGARFVKFAYMSYYRLPYILPLMLMILYATYLVFRQIPKIEFALLLNYLLSILLFSSYFFSTWAEYPRYFAPAFVSLLITCTALHLRHGTLFGRKTVLSWILVFCSLSLLSLSYLANDKIAGKHIYGTRDIRELTQDTGCVYLLPVEDAMDRKDIDFIHSSVGYEEAERIAARYGRKMCEGNP